jgi:cytoskeleton protein RodZ
LKVDAEPVLALLPKAGAAARLDQAGPGLNTPFRDRMDGHRDGRDLGWLKGPMAWATGLILLGAAAVELLPTQLWSGLFDSTTSGSVPVVLPSTSATFPIASAPVDPAASAVPPEVAAPTLVETVHSAPAATAASGPAAAVDAARLLVVRTSAESWIDVRDAGGQMLLSRVVQAGETVSLDGQIPLRLTVGNASATELSFRGQTIDLAAVSRDNVARLELK